MFSVSFCCIYACILEITYLYSLSISLFLPELLFYYFSLSGFLFPLNKVRDLFKRDGSPLLPGVLLDVDPVSSL